MKMFRIFLDEKVLAGTDVTQSNVTDTDLLQKIYLEYTADTRDLHTVAITQTNAGDRSPYLILLITNVPGNMITAGALLMEYEPMVRGGRYEARVFRQTKYIRPIQRRDRDNFKLNDFVRRHALQTVHALDFVVGEPPRAQTPKAMSRRVSFDVPVKATTPRAPSIRKDEKDWFKDDSDLTERQRKFCRCNLRVAAKQTDECLSDKSKWGIGGCYNPYAVCAKSTRTTLGRRPCAAEFDFEKIPGEFLRAYAVMENIPLGDGTPETLRRNIREWKTAHGKV